VRILLAAMNAHVEVVTLWLVAFAKVLKSKEKEYFLK
jgi:hypothetical protein